MSQTESPKIEFPCDYPIKVIGQADADFCEFVIATVKTHAPDLDIERIEENPSRNGKYLSVRLWILATGEQQLQQIFEDLKASGRVQMVL
jgi:putative lipoic acid-binding regulatory protein